MMRNKIVDLLSITALVASPVALGVVYLQTATPQANAETVVVTNQNFPLNRAQVVNFDHNQGFNKLSSRQKSDQLRDWLLITVLSGKGLDSSQISQSIYDLPTVRYEFMSATANFEYGVTRSRYLGDGKVVAIVPKATSQQEHQNNLAYIADRHRKDQGEKPKVIEVFEYAINPNLESATITRRDDIGVEKIFSSEYGYYETTISNQSDLQNFLTQVDDITFAQVSGSSLNIGGRKIVGDNSQGIRLEDIAALWQSEYKIGQSLLAPQSSHDIVEKPPILTGLNVPNIDEIPVSKSKPRLVGGSGFSLDWEYNYSGLEKALDDVTPLLKYLKVNGKAIISDEEIQKAKQGIKAAKNGNSKDAIGDYYTLIEKMQKYRQTEEYRNILNQGELAQKIRQEAQPEITRLEQEEKIEIANAKSVLQAELNAKLKSAEKSAKSDEEIQQIANAETQQLNAKYYQAQRDIIKRKTQEIQQVTSQKADQKIATIKNFVNSDRTQGFQYARYDGDLQGTEVGMVLFYTDLVMKLWGFNYQNSTIETGIKEFLPQTKVAVSSIYQKEQENLSSTRFWLGPNDKGFQVANAGNNIIFAHDATRIYAASSNPSRPGAETTARVDSDAFLSWWNNHYREVARYEPQYQRLNQIMKWSLVINWLNDANMGDNLGFLQQVDVKRDNWFPNWVKAQGQNLKFQAWDKIKFFPPNYKGQTTEALELVTSEKFKRFGQEGNYFYGGVSLADRGLFQKRLPLPENISLHKPSLRSHIDYKSLNHKAGRLEFQTLDGTTYRVQPVTKNVSESIVTPKAETKLRSPNAELTNQTLSQKIAQTLDGVEIESDIGGIAFGNLNVTKTANGFQVGFNSRAIDEGYATATDLSTFKGDLPTFVAKRANIELVRYSSSQPNVIYAKPAQSDDGWLKLSTGGGGGGNVKPPSRKVMSVGEPEDGARNFNVEYIKATEVSQQTQGFKEIPGAASGYGKGLQEISNPSKEIQKLIIDPLKYKELKKLELEQRIKGIDEIFKAGNYQQASKLIDKSLAKFPFDANLRLRKSLVDLQQGKLQVEKINSQGTQTYPTQNFFDEINNHSYRQIETKEAVINIQDSPKLNHLDFNQPISHSVSSGSGARFYKLSPGNVGEIKLSNSGVGDGTASSQVPNQSKTINNTNTFNIRVNNSLRRSTSYTCPENEEEQKNQNRDCTEEKSIYFVIE